MVSGAGESSSRDKQIEAARGHGTDPSTHANCPGYGAVLSIMPTGTISHSIEVKGFLATASPTSATEEAQPCLGDHYE